MTLGQFQLFYVRVYLKIIIFLYFYIITILASKQLAILIFKQLAEKMSSLLKWRKSQREVGDFCHKLEVNFSLHYNRPLHFSDSTTFLSPLLLRLSKASNPHYKYIPSTVNFAPSWYHKSGVNSSLSWHERPPHFLPLLLSRLSKVGNPDYKYASLLSRWHMTKPVIQNIKPQLSLLIYTKQNLINNCNQRKDAAFIFLPKLIAFITPNTIKQF